ncbi:fatty acid CoA ligase [Actinocatenispora thailandica]|uniref:Fatty acid CoA ligase n=1 Tax=Actinocatenispora thailandica TaxID=227318 RepID=A0A7R7DKA8_9ACTN|nr:AMP-binding protein [Actinocatenispora thailandica]BCJ32987.1 fatty acid CoA ligase [Actinocatenispora thailandica]
MPARYVTDLFDALHAHGDTTALVAGDRSWSFAELRTDAYRTARALVDLGVGPGDGLLLLAGNTPDALVVRLAGYLLGLRFTHVHLGPTTQSVPHIVADAAPALVVAADAGLPLLDGSAPGDRTRGARVVPLRRLAALAASEPGDPLPIAAAEGDIARISYTGGTTGLPKGVPTTYAALHAAARSALAGAAAAREELADRTAHARFLAVTPIAHVAGDMALMMLTLGVTVETYDFEPGAMLASLAALRGGVALTYLYPALLGQLLDHPDRPRTDTSALSFVVYGSAPIAPARLRAAIDAFGPVFQQGYASTEAPAITALTVADHVRGLDDRPELLASAGRPLPGVEVTIRDAAGTVLPGGEIGEVCVRSASVMPGYWHRPAETAAVLRDGWLHTGDLGRFDDDGYLYLVGRAREMIIVGGWNCYAAPIEAALTEHPAVRAASVLGVPDETTGEAIVAYLVADSPVPVDELRTAVTARLPEINVPSRIEYLDALPLTPLGKPDKNALHARSH